MIKCFNQDSPVHFLVNPPEVDFHIETRSVNRSFTITNKNQQITKEVIKMKRIMGLVALFVFCLTAISLAEETETFIKAGDCQAAIPRLEEEIYGVRNEKGKVVDANPTAEAYYDLGLCYLDPKVNQARKAEDNFSHAINLSPSYGPRVADIYERFAGEDLKTANLVSAQEKLELAISHDPSRRMAIVKKLEVKGCEMQSIGVFDYAIELNNGTDSELKHRIASFLWDLSGKEPNEEDRIVYRVKAAKLWSEKYREEMVSWAEINGNKNLEAAKLQARIPDKPGSKFHENMTNELKANAILFYNAAGQNGQAIVESALPDTVKYTPRTDPYDFPLKAGEQTMSWIKVGSFSSRFLGDKSCHFYVLYRDGVMVEEGKTRSMGMAVDFKFVAISDCLIDGGIGLVVK